MTLDYTTNRELALTFTQHLANRAHEPAYTLFEEDGYHIATEADLPYWPDAAQIAEFAPATIGRIPIEPDPDDGEDQGGDQERGLEGCTCCGAPALVLNGGSLQCADCHLGECAVCAPFPRCMSCGDQRDNPTHCCTACLSTGVCGWCGSDEHDVQGCGDMPRHFVLPVIVLAMPAVDYSLIAA